jgi:hypothetical protein
VPTHPHEYVVGELLGADERALFDAFVRLIGQHGYSERFEPGSDAKAGASGRYRYLAVDGHRYWVSKACCWTA